MQLKHVAQAATTKKRVKIRSQASLQKQRRGAFRRLFINVASRAMELLIKIFNGKTTKTNSGYLDGKGFIRRLCVVHRTNKKGWKQMVRRLKKVDSLVYNRSLLRHSVKSLPQIPSLPNTGC